MHGCGGDAWSRTDLTEKNRGFNQTQPASLLPKEFGPRYGYFGAVAARIPPVRFSATWMSELRCRSSRRKQSKRSRTCKLAIGARGAFALAYWPA
jgi:hypothetical protein